MMRKRKERASYTCQTCGTVFEDLPSQRSGKDVYCSRPCAQIGAAAKRKRIDAPYLVDGNTGCWVWQHSPSSRYGKVRVGTKHVSAHRLYWEQRNGPIPAGLHVHHTCENTRCVNPDHMALVAPSSHARHHRASLSEEAVRSVRESTDRPSRLAQKFNVSASTICDIRAGRTWNK